MIIYYKISFYEYVSLDEQHLFLSARNLMNSSMRKFSCFETTVAELMKQIDSKLTHWLCHDNCG